MWPGGFPGRGGGHLVLYPRELLAGNLICGVCGNSVAKVSGKNGGYLGCIKATRRGCDNRLLVRRTLAERVILAAVRERLDASGNSGALPLLEILEQRTGRSALLLRKLLGRLRLEPVKPESGRPYYQAVADLQMTTLLGSGISRQELSAALRDVSTSAKTPFRVNLSEAPTAAG